VTIDRLGLGITCSLLAFAASAERNLEEEARRAKDLTKAMQSAQLLISELADAFDCDYAGYDVTPTDTGESTTYVVIIEVGRDRCDDMIKALNYEGAASNLAFVTETKMPEMRPFPKPEPDPVRELEGPPTDYSLIHEVDPPVDQ
jgi:hypothetical protein